MKLNIESKVGRHAVSLNRVGYCNVFVRVNNDKIEKLCSYNRFLFFTSHCAPHFFPSFYETDITMLLSGWSVSNRSLLAPSS